MLNSLDPFPQTLSGKTVLVRTNFDVPFAHGQVQDTTRIESNLATIKLLLQHQCRVVIISHQDRPDGTYQDDSSLKPVIPILEKYLNVSVAFIAYKPDFSDLQVPGGSSLSLLDNLRFWPEEEANNPVFSQHLASFGQAFVNEAFANCHRQHASIVGLPLILPSYAGISLHQEIQVLESVTKNPQKPLIVVLGGAKLETKEPLVNKFSPIAQAILVGGKIAADLSQSPNPLASNIHLAKLTPDTKDITPESAHSFAQMIDSAGTVIWNGTMGVFEEPQHQEGTKIIAEAVQKPPVSP